MKPKLFFVICLFVLTSVHANDKQLKVGYFVTPPHIFITSDEAKPEGSVVRLWEQVALKMGYTINWVKMPLARILVELELGNLDAGSLFVPTPKRQESYIFPESILDLVQPGIVLLTDHELDQISSPSDISHLTISYIRDGVQTPWIKENNTQLNLMHGSDSLARLIKMLVYKRVEAVYWPVISDIVHESYNQNIIDKVKILPLPEGPYPIQPIFAKTEKGQMLADSFDAYFPDVMEALELEAE